MAQHLFLVDVLSSCWGPTTLRHVVAVQRVAGSGALLWHCHLGDGHFRFSTSSSSQGLSDTGKQPLVNDGFGMISLGEGSISDFQPLACRKRSGHIVT